MTYLTAKDLREKLATLPDETRIAIKQKTNDGDSLYFDLKCQKVTDKNFKHLFFLTSQGLDYIIEGEKEQLKEEVTPW